MAKIKELKRRAAVKGGRADCVITVVDIEWHGSAAVELMYGSAARKPSLGPLYTDRGSHTKDSRGSGLLEKREVESKLLILRKVLTEQGIFEDPTRKLLIYTDHKDTLDHLVEKMPEKWQRSVIQIQDGMKIGDRDTTGERSLNLSAIVAQSAEAKERRLVPEVVEDFFLLAGPMLDVHPKETATRKHSYWVGRVPNLWTAGGLLEPRYSEPRKKYKQIVFDKGYLPEVSIVDWVTPCHPREDLPNAKRAKVFYDDARTEPARLDVYSATIRDGLGNIVHRRLFVVETSMDGSLAVLQPPLFLDVVPAPVCTAPPMDDGLPSGDVVEQSLNEKASEPFLEEIPQTRPKESDTISNHVEISLKDLIHRQNLRMTERLSSDHSREATERTKRLTQAFQLVQDDLGRLLRGHPPTAPQPETRAGKARGRPKALAIAGEKILALRGDDSQTAFCRKCKISTDILQRAERGAATQKTIIKICKYAAKKGEKLTSGELKIN
jgi:hypothetical protein